MSFRFCIFAEKLHNLIDRRFLADFWAAFRIADIVGGVRRADVIDVGGGRDISFEDGATVIIGL